MEKEIIYIDDQFITLSQLLKLTNIFDSGGMIKHFIQDEGVLVNSEKEHRRGKKIYPNDEINIAGNIYIVQIRNRE